MRYGLGNLADNASDLQAQIDKLNKELASLAKQLSVSQSGYRVQPYPAPDPTIEQNAITARMNSINAEIAALTNQLNSIISAADAKAAAYAASPVGVAAANKTAADNFRQQMFFMAQPGYDYGKGASKRNEFYKGLGDIMIPKTSHSLYNLHNQDGLAGLFEDILAGGRVAVTQFKASGSKLPAMPNIPGGVKLAGVSAPAWLQNLGKAVVSGAKVVQERRAAPAVNIATGGAAYVEPQAPAPNYLAWGAAAVAVGLAAVALRSKR